jgi:hypothetical protein
MIFVAWLALDISRFPATDTGRTRFLAHLYFKGFRHSARLGWISPPLEERVFQDAPFL